MELLQPILYMFGITIDRIKYQITDLTKSETGWHYKAIELGLCYVVNGTLSESDKLFRIKLESIKDKPHTITTFEPANLSDIDCKVIIKCLELSVSCRPIMYSFSRVDSSFMQSKDRMYDLAPYSAGIIAVYFNNGDVLKRYWVSVETDKKTVVYEPIWKLWDINTEEEYQVRKLSGIRQ